MTSVSLPGEAAIQERRFEGVLDKLARGTSVYILGAVLNKVFLLAIQVMLARMLHVSGYGLFNLGFSTLMLVHSITLMGLDQAVLRFGSLYRGRGQMESIKGILLASLALGALTSIIAAVSLILSSPAVSAHSFREPQLAPVLQLFALALPFYIVARITGAFAQAHHDIVRMTLIQQVSQPGVHLVLVALLFYWGGGLWWAVSSFLASMIFSALVGLYCIRSIFPEFFSSLRARLPSYEFLKFSVALSMIAILYQLFWRAPSLLLGHLAGASQVGLYSAAATLASPPGFISLIFAQPFMPMMVDLYEQGNLRELSLLYRTVTRWTYLVVIPSFGFLVVFRKPVLAMFGKDFKDAGEILVTLGLAWMIYYSKGPVAAVLDMTGRQIIDLANMAGVVGLSLGLGRWLIPRSGARGAGWAIAISILAWSAAELIEGWILFRFPPFNRHLFQSLLVAGAIFGGAVLLQDRVSLAVEAVLVGGLYVLLCFLFVIPPSDRDLLRRAVKKASAFFIRPAVAPARD